MYAVQDAPPSRKSFLSIAAAWFLLIFAVIYGFLDFLYNVGATFFTRLTENLFGWVGKTLITLFLVSLLSAVIYENQQDGMQHINEGYCLTAPTRHVISNGIDLVAPYVSPFICLYNLVNSWLAIIIQASVPILYNCTDWQAVWIDFKAFFAALTESVLSFLFTDQTFLGNRLDVKSVIIALQVLIGDLQGPLDCYCEAFSEVFAFVFNVLTDSHLPCALDILTNAVIAFLQGYYATLVNFLRGNYQVPSLVFINDVCSGTICLGMFIDDVFIDFFSLFFENPPNMALGCMASQLVCVATDIIYIFVNLYVQLIWTLALQGLPYNFFIDTNASPLLNSLTNLGKCVQTSLTVIDPCLGQAGGNAILVVAAVIEYFVQIIQFNNQDLSIVLDAVELLVGQSTYGGGDHILAPNGHSNPMNQTSLTCFVSDVLNWGIAGTCNIAVGDLANSFVQLFLIPLVILDEILIGYPVLQSIDGNPFQTKATQDDVTEFITTIFLAITNQFLNVLDYLGHLVGCLPLLSGLGSALVVSVKNLANIINDVVGLLVLLIEFITEIIIVIITVFAGPIFPNDSIGNEFGIFVRIFIQVIIDLVTLLVQTVETIVNFTIGFFFPALFSQPTLYSNANSPATLTACVGDFGDCICGITLTIANAICIDPLPCLGSLWPACGLFQKSPTTSSGVPVTFRKRSSFGIASSTLPEVVDVYSNPFTFFAQTFPNGHCGDVFREFERFGEHWEQNDGNISAEIHPVESEIMTYLACVDFVKESLKYFETKNYTVSPHYLLESYRFRTSTTEFVKGVGSIVFMSLDNSMRYLDSPEYMAGIPTNAKPKYITLEEHLKRQNITDSLAVDYTNAVYEILSTAFTHTKKIFYDRKEQTPETKFTNLGRSFSKLTTTAWATAKLVGNEFAANSNEIYDGISDSMSSLSTVASSGEWREYMPQNFNRKRNHDGPLGSGHGHWFPPGVATEKLNELGHEPLVITRADTVFFKATKAFQAWKAWGGKAFGAYFEGLARRTMKQEQFDGLDFVRYGNPILEVEGPYDHIAPYHVSEHGFYGWTKLNSKRNIWPNDLVYNQTEYPYLGFVPEDVHTNVSFLYGMNGMIDFQFNVPNSCGAVMLYCDTNNASNCFETDYYQTLGLCQNFIANFGIVMQCNESFQAMAIFATNNCSGAPIRIAIADVQKPIACVRFNVQPPGPVNDYMCMQYQQCQSCPTTQVIPGFPCQALDQIFQAAKYYTQRCIVQFIGKVFPAFNFSLVVQEVTNPSILTPTSLTSLPGPNKPGVSIRCGNYSVCGDGILSTERNSKGQNCEQCDDRNLDSGDGCSSTCQFETCWAMPPNDANTPPNRPLNSIKHITCAAPNLWSIQTPILLPGGPVVPNSQLKSQYPSICTARALHPVPWNGLDVGTAYDSFEIISLGRFPQIVEYSDTRCGINNIKSRRTVMNKCANETGVCLSWGTFPTGDIACLVDFPVDLFLTGNQVCNTCGSYSLANPTTNSPITDPAPNRPILFVTTTSHGFLCDYVKTHGSNPAIFPDDPQGFVTSYNSPNEVGGCNFCLPIVIVNCTPGLLCQGYCRARTGYVHNVLGSTASGPPQCLQSPTTNIGCPQNSECFYYTTQAARKRDVLSMDKHERLAQIMKWHNAQQHMIPMEEAYPQHYEPDETYNYEEQSEVVVIPQEVNFVEDVHLHPRRSDPIIQLETTIIPKSSFMVDYIFKKANEIIDLFKPGGGSDIQITWKNAITKFLTSTKIDKYAPPSERGLLWYVVFPFDCQLPVSLDCSLGIGLSDGIVLFIYIFFAGIAIASFLYTGLSSLWVSLFSMLGLSVFMGVTFGYAFPGCVLLGTSVRLPECIGTEIASTFNIFNGTCIGFLQDFSTSPCTSACDQTLIDCRTIGFIDGFDTLIAIIEIWFPASFSTWIRTSQQAAFYKTALQIMSTLSGFDLIGSFNTALANFDLQGAPGTYPQKVCAIVTSLSIAQIGVFLIIIYAFTLTLYSILVPLFAWIGLLLYAFINWIDQNFVEQYDPADDRAMAIENYKTK
jgi:cysteine-rich repeat protein